MTAEREWEQGSEKQRDSEKKFLAKRIGKDFDARMTEDKQNIRKRTLKSTNTRKSKLLKGKVANKVENTSEMKRDPEMRRRNVATRLAPRG